MDKKIFVIAKIFDQQGCIAYRCKTPNEARCLPGTLEALRLGKNKILELLAEGEIDGAFKIGRTWRIPKTSIINYIRRY